MDRLMKKILDASGISGSEEEIAAIMREELAARCDEARIDPFGNVIARKGKGGPKVMIAAHMDEIGLMVKHVSKEGFISFIKVGGIDDRVLLAQRVVIKAAAGDILGIIGTKPPHLQKEEEKAKPVKYEDMFIDAGFPSREAALRKLEIGDPIVFEASAGVLGGDLMYGKAVDDRIGCYALIKLAERLAAPGEYYLVATTQEEVGLKGARTSSFAIDPDYAIAIDVTMGGDTPAMRERESSLKLGQGVAVTLIEASGRGVIVSAAMRRLLIDAAKRHKIAYQVDVIEGGMTDGAMIYMNRSGIPTAVLSIPTRYIHAPTGVFSMRDVDAAVELAFRAAAALAGKKKR